MFKKFKDKLAEEMKQSPARLQASVQQLAQAVVSPALSNSSIQEVSASNDNFSLTEDGDETPKNTPVKHSFQSVDLMPPSANAEASRRSSVSSITSDASSLFPMYESPPNLYQLQSDMDQSASELDDSISPHLDRVTKDQLYSAYRKVQAKYHKYRGRYTDLATHYRELDRVKTRLESVLVETQDKVLRRITDLKEQCQLEQQAKAHLEEALRNDIEEKDHVINTLTTKVKLLQDVDAGSGLENSMSEEQQQQQQQQQQEEAVEQKENSKDNLIDLSSNETPTNDGSSALMAENVQLNDRMKKLESLVLRYKESLKRNKDKFVEMMREKQTLESEHETLKSTAAERISSAEVELSAARAAIASLTEQVEVLHKREEESAISLAENKLSVHRELEEKEEQIKQLRIDLKHTAELSSAKSSSDAPKGKLTDSSAAKSSAQQAAPTRQQQQQQREEVDRDKEVSVAKSPRADESSGSEETTSFRSREREAELGELRRGLDELERQLAEQRRDKETLQTELSSCKLRYSELRSEHDAQRIVAEERRKDADATIEKLQATVQSVDRELENMRGALTDRDQVCENYNRKVQQYATMLEKAKHRLAEQETQTKSLKGQLAGGLEQLAAAQRELEDKRAELGTARGELEQCRSTIDDLGNKVQADSSAIHLLKKERSDLMNRLVHYKDCARRLKRDCADVRGAVRDELSSRRAEVSALNATLVARLERESATLTARAEEARLRLELGKIAALKSSLETALKANSKGEPMVQSDELADQLGALVGKLIAEMDNLQFKVYDLEKASSESTESQRELESLRAQLQTQGDLELERRTLSSENDHLRRDLAQAGRAAADEAGDRKLREEELRAELARCQGDLVAKGREIEARDDKIARQAQQLAHLISTCDSHVQTIEEHVRKYLDLEADYQATRESHARQTAELMESNVKLQKTLDIWNAELTRLNALVEQQAETIEQTSAELRDLGTERAELSDSLAAADRQIESLRSEGSSQLAALASENKDLKDKHNNLLSHDRKLRENEEAMKRRIDDCEKQAEELRREAESCRSRADSRGEEAERLSDQLTAVSAQLESKSAEASSSSERLQASERQLRETKERLDQRDAELLGKISELDAAAISSNVMTEEKERLLEELKSFRSQAGKLKALLARKNVEMEDIRQEKDRLAAELAVCRDKLVETEDLRSRYEESRSETSVLMAQSEENRRLRLELEAARSASDDSSAELSALKDSLARKEAEAKSTEERSVDTLEFEATELLRYRQAVEERSREADELRARVVEMQSEIESLEVSRQDREDARRAGEEVEKLREENKRLEAQLDEALITFQAKETQIQMANNELREQLGRLKEQAKTSEEEQGMRLKQLVKEFQAQLHDKEEELQAALEKRFDRQHNYESDLVQQYKEQLKDFQVELTEKSEQIENLVLEKKDAVAEKGEDIDRLVETIAQMKKEHANEIREVEKKWKAIMQQRIDNLQTNHDEELNELTKEWQNERKPDVQTEAAAKELESTSFVARAALHTNTGSIHTMQQILASQRREIAELRKLVKLRHDTLEDSTEIEYLRNILFEYMMGRETIVLARVIAAVVKFDQEQTSKIMKKEEDKLTLFGSLGLA